MVEQPNGSSNSAIFAIFVIVVVILVLVYFFVPFRTGETRGTTLEGNRTESPADSVNTRPNPNSDGGR